MTVYLVGVIAGNLIQTFEVRGATEPVHVVGVDNTITLHYWSMQHTRFEVMTIDLFANMPDPGAASVVFGKKDRNNTRSGYKYATSARPLVASSSVIYPHGLQAVGVTQTRRGITPRTLLVGTDSHRVFMLTHADIAPRRPVGKGTVLSD